MQPDKEETFNVRELIIIIVLSVLFGYITRLIAWIPVAGVFLSLGFVLIVGGGIAFLRDALWEKTCFPLGLLVGFYFGVRRFHTSSEAVSWTLLAAVLYLVVFWVITRKVSRADLPDPHDLSQD